MLEAMPEDYDAVVEELLLADFSYRERIAKYLEPKMNWKLARCPSASFGEKKQTATWLNGTLAALGLNLYSQTKQSPVMLAVERGNYGQGRFGYDSRIEPTTSGIAAYERLETTDELSDVHIRAANLRCPQWDGWSHEVGRKRSAPRSR